MKTSPFRIDFRGSNGTLEYKTLYSVGADIPAQPYRPDPLLDESCWNEKERQWELWGNTRKLIPTGIVIVDVDYKSLNEWEMFGLKCIPSFHILPRSSLSKKGISASIGTIEVDYENFEMFVCLENNTNEKIVIPEGMRIGQLKCGVALRAPGIPVREAIREGGFGSTGM